MNEYKCQDCSGLQYSASPDKAGEPCIYCGGKNVQLEPEKAQKEQEDPE
ncbi:hypothetical protein [Tepidibacillus marianensis]